MRIAATPPPGGLVKRNLHPASASAAQVLGVTRAALSAVPNERTARPKILALRIEKAFGVSTARCL